MKCGRKRKYLPNDDALLKRMFIEDGMSGVEIANIYGADMSSTYKLLRRIGIDTSQDRSRICKAKGCGKLSLKIWSATTKCYYGRLCRKHRKEHYANLNREIQRRKKNLTPDQFAPWKRKYGELTEYEKEKLWILKAGKEHKKLVKWLKEHREA